MRRGRRESAAGGVAGDERGVPDGGGALDLGRNGILVTEKEASGTSVIHVEPWVEPMTHPFVVAARDEGGKNVEAAAKSVLLRVK